MKRNHIIICSLVLLISNIYAMEQLSQKSPRTRGAGAPTTASSTPPAGFVPHGPRQPGGALPPEEYKDHITLPPASIADSAAYAYDIHFNPNRQIRAKQQGNNLLLIDSATDKTIYIINNAQFDHFSPNEQVIAVRQGDHIILVDSTTGAIIRTYISPQKAIQPPLAINPDTAAQAGDGSSVAHAAPHRSVIDDLAAIRANLQKKGRK